MPQGLHHINTTTTARFRPWLVVDGDCPIMLTNPQVHAPLLPSCLHLTGDSATESSIYVQKITHRRSIERRNSCCPSQQ
jgi:hypothetical protein